MGIFGDFGSGFSENSKEIQEAYDELQFQDDRTVVKAFRHGLQSKKAAARKILQERYPDEDERRMIVAQYK